MPRRRAPVLAVAIALALAGVALIAAGMAHHGDPPDARLPAAVPGGRPAAAGRTPPVRLRLTATRRPPAPLQLPALAPGAGGPGRAARGARAARGPGPRPPGPRPR